MSEERRCACSLKACWASAYHNNLFALNNSCQWEFVFITRADVDLHDVIRTMAGSGFDIELATTVREARQRIALERFDVVILDINLPDGSGWELLPLIRDRQPEARVVILSGTDTTEDEINRVEAVLLKSQVSAHELLDAIGRRIHHQTPRSRI